MALTDPYCDLETFKARAGITGTGNDPVLLQVLSEASRQIEQWTGRIFNQTAAGVSRYVTAMSSDTVFVDDLVSVSAIATDDGNRTYSTVWAETDYDLTPYNAAEIGRPYTIIQRSPRGRYQFYGAPKGVQVTGVWGWPSVPDDIFGATVIQALRLWKRQSAPFGVTGSDAIGGARLITTMDPDVKAMITPYRRVVF